jgi:hypothetical protein
MSDAARGQAAVLTEQGEEDAIPSLAGARRANVTRTSKVTLSALLRHLLTLPTVSTDIYYGPTNVVGQACNTNFGTNYGQRQIQLLILSAS